MYARLQASQMLVLSITELHVALILDSSHYNFKFAVSCIVNSTLPFILQLSRYSDCLRAGMSGIESRWGRDFPPVQTGPGAHPASSKMGTGSFPGVKCGRSVLLTTHPLLVSRSWKSRAIPLPTLWATTGL